MKKRFKEIAVTALILLATSAGVYLKLKPTRELKYFPSYTGTTNFKYSHHVHRH